MLNWTSLYICLCAEYVRILCNKSLNETLDQKSMSISQLVRFLHICPSLDIGAFFVLGLVLPELGGVEIGWALVLLFFPWSRWSIDEKQQGRGKGAHPTTRAVKVPPPSVLEEALGTWILKALLTKTRGATGCFFSGGVLIAAFGSQSKVKGWSTVNFVFIWNSWNY